MTRLMKKIDFADYSGASPATVTRHAKSTLKAAMVGKRVDADHPDAIEFVKKQQEVPPVPPATGLDPMYEQALWICRNSGRFSTSFLRQALGVGANRSKKLIDQMRALGTYETPPDGSTPPSVSTPAASTAPVRSNVPAKPAPSPRKIQNLIITPPPQENVILEIPEDIQTFGHMTLRELIDRFGTDTRFLDWLRATKEIENINEKRVKNAEKEGTLVSRKLVEQGIIEPIETAHIKMMTDGAETISRRAVAMIGAGRTEEDLKKFVADQIASFIKPVKTRVARLMKDYA